MANILHEYIKRNMSFHDLEKELRLLISKYNDLTGRYLFLYSSNFGKGRNPGVDFGMVQDDFYTIQDILREAKSTKLDFYIETPGGSGEAAEEIARFLRNKFEEVNFVIVGESKSAGTILALSGDNIFMTETGSLGPIDAQIRIGRSSVSAHDYIEWVNEKRVEAQNNGRLNPFDAIMVAQMSPGELAGVNNSLEFAKDLVKEWLEKYKFKNWEVTETRNQTVTPEMKKARADEVADLLCNHTTWRTHGRSLKIEDLSEYLKIVKVDDDKDLADILYRIKTVVRLILDGSNVYKIFAIDEYHISRTFTANTMQSSMPIPISPAGSKKQTGIEVVEVGLDCPKCHKKHKVLGGMDASPDQIKAAGIILNPNIKENDIFVCDSCGYAINLKPIINQIENQRGKKVTLK